MLIVEPAMGRGRYIDMAGMHCQGCNNVVRTDDIANITGASSVGVCAQCGRPFDPDDVTSFAQHDLRRTISLMEMVLVGGICLVFMALVFGTITAMWWFYAPFFFEGL